MNSVVREIGASFIEGMLKQPSTEEVVVLNLATVGSLFFFPGVSFAIMVGSSLGCSVTRGVVEVFTKFNHQAKKLEKETTAFVVQLKGLQALEEKNSADLKRFKESLQESFRIVGVAQRILYEGRIKVEQKVEKLAGQIEKQQSTIEALLERVRQDRQVNDAIRLQCELHNSVPLVVKARECHTLADRFFATATQQDLQGVVIYV